MEKQTKKKPSKGEREREEEEGKRSYWKNKKENMRDREKVCLIN
jgi:hypothetical protein